MGGCFRTDENVPISLPPFIWKLLVGDNVTWKYDFIHVDDTAVRNIGMLAVIFIDDFSPFSVSPIMTKIKWLYFFFSIRLFDMPQKCFNSFMTETSII